MNPRVFIPIIDLAFLSLGAIVAVLSQTRLIEALPVEVTEVGRGIAGIVREDVTVVTITEDALYADGRPVGWNELAGAVSDRLVLLRADRGVPAERLVRVMSILSALDVELRIEVEETERGGEPAS